MENSKFDWVGFGKRLWVVWVYIAFLGVIALSLTLIVINYQSDRGFNMFTILGPIMLGALAANAPLAVVWLVRYLMTGKTDWLNPDLPGFLGRWLGRSQ